MRTASIGRPSWVRKSAFSVPSRALASRSKASADSGTRSSSSARSSAGRLVISSYDRAPRATHSQICLPRKGGSPRAASVLSRSSKSTGQVWQGRGANPGGCGAYRGMTNHPHAKPAQRRPETDVVQIKPAYAAEPAHPLGNPDVVQVCVSVDVQVARLAARQHGVVSRRQLTALGMTRGTIDRWVKQGRLHRVHQGVYLVGRP